MSKQSLTVIISDPEQSGTVGGNPLMVVSLLLSQVLEEMIRIHM